MRLAAALLSLALVFGAGASPAPAAGPSVAVMAFSSQGLDVWWEAGFDPGGALSDLVADQLVNKSTFAVVDRQHVADVVQEHNLAASGEVSPATAITAGRLIGARYLVVGRIVQFQQTQSSGPQVGIPIGPVGIGGSSRSDRVNLVASVKVIDASTGQIVEAFQEEQQKSAHSFSAAGFGGGAYGAYDSKQFLSTPMGQLLQSAAIEIAGKIDPAKMTAGAVNTAVLRGRIIAVSSGNYVLNIGSAKGVQVGAFFDVVSVVTAKDPDSGKILTSHITKGKIQILSVDTDTAVGTKVSGSAAVDDAVQSE